MAEPTTSGASSRRWTDEDGYIIPQLALLLIPLIIFAALATDVGAWYLHGQKIQRAADAAALGAVAFLPDEAAAEAHARDIATRNGYTDITPGNNADLETGDPTQVQIEFLGAGALEVEIKARSQAFFGRIVLDGIDIVRYARSQQVAPIRMGNPTSALGTGDLPESEIGPGVEGDNVWLSFSSYCEQRSSGDPFGTGGITNDASAGNICTGSGTPSVANPNYDSDAYVFVVETQPGGGAIDIEVRNPGAPCPGDADDINLPPGLIQPVIVFEVYGPNPNTNHRQFVDTNAPIVGPIAYDRNVCNGWETLASNLASLGNGGHYYVVGYARGPGTTAAGPGDYTQEVSFNTTSLRVTSGANGACTFSNANPICPQLSALDWLHIYRDIPTDAEAFLAEIPQSFAGGSITVSFFDAAEGITGLQFAGPDGVAVPYDWRYADVSIGNYNGPNALETQFTPAADQCNWNNTGPAPCLDTSTGDWNDRFVEVRFDVPPNYTCNGDDCWWTIRFGSGQFPTDRSAWTVFADGDPIRLVE